MNRKTLKRVVAGGLLAASFVVSTVPVYADEIVGGVVGGIEAR